MSAVAILTWDPSPENYFLVEAQYKPATSPDTEWQLVVAPPGSTLLRIAGLDEGVAYDFRIRHRSSPTGRASDWVPPLTIVLGPASSADSWFRFLVLDADPVTAPGAGLALLYVVRNLDGTATLRIQAGTDPTPLDIAVNFGGGV
jgi:hypothetical protein